jgi:hypothetical protein
VEHTDAYGVVSRVVIRDLEKGTTNKKEALLAYVEYTSGIKGWVPADNLRPLADLEGLRSALKSDGHKKKYDVVNNPSHYGGADNPYEVIKVLEAWGLDKDALLFNVVKYVSRAGKKDSTKLIEDLEKASWYLQRKIANLKKVAKPSDGEPAESYGPDVPFRR